MPILFWLPTIFMGAFFELAKIACESTERSLAGEIVDMWWGSDPEIERARAERHHIDLEEYGREHGVLRPHEGLVQQLLGAATPGNMGSGASGI
jgi:hypothetical protein